MDPVHVPAQPADDDGNSRDRCALYRFYATDDTLLYIGITSALPLRLKVHDKQQPWYHLVASVKVEHFDTRELALKAEESAIRTEQPRWNVVHNEAVTGAKPRQKSQPDSVRSMSGGYPGADPEAILAQVEVARLTGLGEEEVVRLGSRGYLRWYYGFGRYSKSRSYIESTVEALIEVNQLPDGPERDAALEGLRAKNWAEDRRRKDVANQMLFEAGIIKAPVDPVWPKVGR